MSEDKIAEDLTEVRGKILKGDFNWANTNGVIVCSTKEFSRMERRIEELEAEIEEARQRLLIEQDNCEHEELFKHGDGRVYGVCKKCLKELY